MKVLVTGGRNFRETSLIYDALDAIFKTDGEDMILVTGGATGADRRAMEWAIDRQVPYFTFPARWKRYAQFGNKKNPAGMIRNGEMLKKAPPNIVLAFPTPGAENNGTRGMMAIAAKAGIMVIDVVEQNQKNKENER